MSDTSHTSTGGGSVVGSATDLRRTQSTPGHSQTKSSSAAVGVGVDAGASTPVLAAQTGTPPPAHMLPKPSGGSGGAVVLAPPGPSTLHVDMRSRGAQLPSPLGAGAASFVFSPVAPITPVVFNAGPVVFNAGPIPNPTPAAQSGGTGGDGGTGSVGGGGSSVGGSDSGDAMQQRATRSGRQRKGKGRGRDGAQ